MFGLCLLVVGCFGGCWVLGGVCFRMGQGALRLLMVFGLCVVSDGWWGVVGCSFDRLAGKHVHILGGHIKYWLCHPPN